MVAGGLAWLATAVAVPSLAVAAAPLPQALYQSAVSNLSASSGVHVAYRASGGGVTQTSVSDVGVTSGVQVMTLRVGKGKIGRGQLKLVDGTVYFTGNSAFYSDTGSATTTPPAGTWLSWAWHG